MNEKKQLVIAYSISFAMCFVLILFVMINLYKSDNLEDQTIKADIHVQSLLDSAKLTTTRSTLDTFIFTVWNNDNQQIAFQKDVSIVQQLEIYPRCSKKLDWFKAEYDKRKVIKTVCKNGLELDGFKPFECPSATVMMYYESWNCSIYNDLVMTMPGVEAIIVSHQE